MSSTITSYRKEPFVLQNKDDNTKKIRIDTSSITSGQTIILEPPDVSGKIALTNDIGQDPEDTQQSYNNEYVFAYLNSNLNCPNNTLVQVNFNIAVSNNNINYNTINGIYTTPRAGLYHFVFGCLIEAFNADAFIQVNCSTHGNIARQRFNQSSSTHRNSVSTQLTIPLDASDEVTFIAWQNSGTTRTIISGLRDTYMSITYLGPIS
jgi:hypothetical protein